MHSGYAVLDLLKVGAKIIRFIVCEIKFLFDGLNVMLVVEPQVRLCPFFAVSPHPLVIQANTLLLI